MQQTEKYKEQLTNKRQYLTVRLYLMVYSLSFIGGLFSIYSNPTYSQQQKINSFILFTVVCSLMCLVLLYTYKRIGKSKWIDYTLLAVTVITYLALIFGVTGKIISLSLWLPVFIAFLFLIMHSKYAYFFLAAHLMVVIINFVGNPVYTFNVTLASYIVLFTVSCMLIYVIPKIIRMFEDYQATILEDNNELLQKNIELNAYNEEYEATQQELFDKYDQVNHLLNEKQDRNRKLTHLVYHDALTSLLNRYGFINTLDNTLKKVGFNELYVLLIDIANFNDINNAYGYKLGDELLINMANTIRGFNLQISHEARVGNDIFALVITDVELDDLFSVLSGKTLETLRLDTYNLKMSYKIGLTRHGHRNVTAEALLKEADIALAHAKSNSTSKYCFFDETLEETMRTKVTLTMALKKAIENEQIFMVYQPIYDAISQEIVGCEALARWIDEDYGFVPPNVFIELSEKATMIHELGDLIIHKVCAFQEKIWSKGLHIHANINVSYLQLKDEGFAERFKSIVSAYHLSPEAIGVEITETILIDDFGLAVEQLTKLYEAGFKVYLDDFGTGYSSLNYLDQLPVNVLKIDKVFIDELMNNERKRHLLSIIVSLADAFELTTVAEGVETSDVASLLKDMHINAIQGYYFSKPLNEKDYLERLTASRL